MTLKKKQVYLNKVLSKHYKKLRYTLFDTPNNIPALKTTAITGAQSISISVLTIGTISHKDFPSIIDITVLNALRKAKKAVILYEGKMTVPTTLTRFISKLVQKHPKTEKLVDASNILSDHHILKPRDSLGTLRIINTMLGTGVGMYNYTILFNSQLSLQHLKCLKHKQNIKLENLDRFAMSLIPPQPITETKTGSLEVQKQRISKRKEIRLSKMELSYIIAQVLYKIYFLKGQESLGESFFNTKKLSNVLGAFVEINSKIYFISDKELKQCGLTGGFQHSKLSSILHNSPPLLKNLMNSKIARDKEILLKMKSIEPNITFFTFLNIAMRAYVIYNIKKTLSRLINIFSLSQQNNSKSTTFYKSNASDCQ